MYTLYPQLRNDNHTQYFIFQMAYQNRLQNDIKYGQSSEPTAMQNYFNYTQTLSSDVREFLLNYDYRHIINEVSVYCE